VNKQVKHEHLWRESQVRRQHIALDANIRERQGRVQQSTSLKVHSSIAFAVLVFTHRAFLKAQTVAQIHAEATHYTSIMKVAAATVLAAIGAAQAFMPAAPLTSSSSLTIQRATATTRMALNAELTKTFPRDFTKVCIVLDSKACTCKAVLQLGLSSKSQICAGSHVSAIY
jgi:hypothetical protein